MLHCTGDWNYLPAHIIDRIMLTMEKVYSTFPKHPIPVVIIVSIEVNSTTGGASVHPAILSPNTIISPSVLSGTQSI